MDNHLRINIRNVLNADNCAGIVLDIIQIQSLDLQENELDVENKRLVF